MNDPRVNREAIKALIADVEHYRSCRVDGCSRCVYDDPKRGRVSRREARDIEGELLAAVRALMSEEP